MQRTITFLVLFLFGVLVANAQTNLNGRYAYKSDKGSNPPSFYLTFERQDAVYYSYFHEGAGTIGGKWMLENGIIKVVLTRGDADWTLKLKQKGNSLEIAEALSENGLPDVPDFKSVLPVGTLFNKIVDKSTGPDLTPQEISNRVLKLVKGIRTLKDISPKNIQLQTGVKVTFHNKNRNEYGYGGNVIGAADWIYGFSAYPYPSKDNQTTDTLRFSFDYQLHEPLKPDTAIISKAFDFNSLSKELQKAGFSAPKPNFGNHNFLSGWTMERGEVSLRVSVKGGFEPNIDNTVTGITVSFTKKEQDSFDKIVLEFKDASVNPESQRNYKIVLTKKSAEIVLESYKVLARETTKITEKQFDKIVKIVQKAELKNRPNLDDGGCSGGTTDVFELFRNEKSILKGNVYHCGGADFGDLVGNSESVKNELTSLFPKVKAKFRSIE